MTLGSLFDGIGGWLLAARHAGVTPIWASEIEPFPCSVTARYKTLGNGMAQPCADWVIQRVVEVTQCCKT